MRNLEKKIILTIFFLHSFILEFQNENNEIVNLVASLPEYFKEKVNEMNTNIEKIKDITKGDFFENFFKKKNDKYFFIMIKNKYLFEKEKPLFTYNKRSCK